MPAAKDTDDKRFMDVAKPGKVAPDATARPVIVGHRAMIQDPMVTASKKEDIDVSMPKKAEKTSKVGKIIQPVGAESEPAPEVAATQASDQPPATMDSVPEESSSESEVVVTEAPADTQSAAAETEAATPEKAADQAESPAAPANPAETASDTAVVDELADQAVKLKAEKKESEEEKAKKKSIEHLIEEKEYYLPIRKVTKKRESRTLTVLLLLILVCVIGAYLLIDAGTIPFDVNLPFDFINK